MITEITENTSLEMEENERFVIERLIDYWNNKKDLKDLFRDMDRISKARMFSKLLFFYKHRIVRFDKFANFYLKQILIGPKIQSIAHLLEPNC